jgi:hypothetical protein
VVETVHIDHHHGVALAIRTTGKGLDSAGLAEEMIDGFGVEPIGRQLVFTREQGEIDFGHGLHDPAQAPAARTVAIAQTGKVGMGGKAHGTAVALALILLFLGHDVLLIETKQEQNLS